MPNPPLPIAVKLTRRKLSDASETVLEESWDTPARRILACSVKKTQSIGDQGADIVLDNTGGRFDAWLSGDMIRVEAKTPGDQAYTMLVEGFIGEPSQAASLRPQLGLPVVGPNSILDLISLSQEHSFASGTGYDDMFDSLCTTYLTGYTRTITATSANCTTRVVFTQGQKLREVLDWIRRALKANTGENWEYLVNRDAATKEIKLFKRATSVVVTIKSKDLLQGAIRYKGSAYDVVNKAQVFGATLPHAVKDNSTLAKVGTVRLDATTDWAAQPFTADDTPLSGHTLYADRSGAKDPPSLQAYVARNSDNIVQTDRAIATRFGAVETRRHASTTGNFVDMFDMDSLTKTNNAGMPTDGVFREWIAWDNGVAISARYYYLGVTGTNAAAHHKLQGSNDDSNWTDLTGDLSGSSNYQGDTLSTTAFRYHRVMYRQTAGLSWSINESRLLEWKNDSADATNPQNAILRQNTMTVATTGAMSKVLAQFDFNTARDLVKFVVRHNSTSASALLNLVPQVSSDGAAWTDIGILASSSTIVVDTVFIEAGADYRYFRLIVKDDRAAASASVTTTITPTSAGGVWVYFASTTWSGPLTGDQMKGSLWTWGVENLVVHPALIEQQTFPAPRLALTVGRKYWFLYVPQTGADSVHWWELDYGTDATIGKAAQKSTDSGVTWVDVAANASFKHKTEFNDTILVGSAEDVASQAKYANLVPGGILYGNLRDEALQSQDQVDREAEALVEARGDVKDRLQIPIPFNPAVDVGVRATLDPDCLLVLGTSGDFDILEVNHELAPGGQTILTLNDHPPTGEAAQGVITGAATGRTV